MVVIQIKGEKGDSGEEGIKRKGACDLPGSFFVRNDAFVIIDLDTVTVVVAGVRATLMPIGPSLGWPGGVLK